MTQPPSDDLDAMARRLRRVRIKFGPAATRVLDILADDPAWILTRTSLDLADRARTSDATAIRTIQALGFKGLPDLKRQVEDASRSRLTVGEKLDRTLRDLRPGFAGAVAEAAEVSRLGLNAIRADVASGAFGAAIDLLHEARRLVFVSSPPWSGLQAYMRWSLADLGFETTELRLDGIACDAFEPTGEPGDVFIALVLPPTSPVASGVIGMEWRRGLPLVLVSDVSVSTTARDVVGLRAPSGLPGHVSLGSAVATLTDSLVLGLLACCPKETIRRASGHRRDCSASSVEP